MKTQEEWASAFVFVVCEARRDATRYVYIFLFPTYIRVTVRSLSTLNPLDV